MRFGGVCEDAIHLLVPEAYFPSGAVDNGAAAAAHDMT